MISLPFQNNTNFGFGEFDRTQNVLNIQPVIPFKLGSNWNLITRTIIPVITQPDFSSETGSYTGLGDINFSAFFSPSKASKFIWGVGPAIIFPSATAENLGSGTWSAGPTVVGLTMQGSWVVGLLVSNVWSFAGNSDRDVFLPTNHGFDEFFGNLYHLNAEEEPERYLYPKDPAFAERFKPRGVIRSSANGTIEDTGPLTKKRMETVDDEFLEATVDFIDEAVKSDKPFFVWFNLLR